MRIKDLKIIHTLFMHKNVTKTAKLLYISQPALTAKIKSIEEELGVTILIRNNKGIEFTSIGKYVAQRAEGILNEYLSFKEELKTMINGGFGTLRIATPYIFSKYKLPEIISKFQKLHPNVNFDIAVVHSGEVSQYLRENFFHFGFVRNNHSGGSEGMLRVESSEISVVCKHAFAMEDLPDLKRIDYQTDSAYKVFLNEWWASHFDRPPTMVATVSDLETCKEMVFSGIGYAFLPRLVIPDDSGLHVQPLLSEKGKPELRHTWMVYQPDILQRQLPQIFYEFVRKEYTHHHSRQRKGA
ncbi:LysR family transcriptional regulator [Desulfovibrio sp. OttesenSCG-928-I05]|nr:LysR family transcriptional regulator [Desulfovibrio sp. OttesenSCG-928-I05]